MDLYLRMHVVECGVACFFQGTISNLGERWLFVALDKGSVENSCVQERGE